MDECTGCAYVIQNRPSSAFMSTVSGWNVQRAGSARNESEPRIKTNIVNNREILKIKPKLFKSIYNKISIDIFQFQIYFCPIPAHPIGVSNLNCPLCSLLHKRFHTFSIDNINETIPKTLPNSIANYNPSTNSILALVLQFSFLQTTPPLV